MNIFILDNDIDKCAEYHCDKHVIKMILETAQILCSVHHYVADKSNDTNYSKEIPYKKTHMNHPSCVWAREDLNNYDWLCSLGLKLCEEYTKRYGKRHKTQDVLDWLEERLPNIPYNNLTDFSITVPEDCIVDNDPVKSYRKYYLTYKTDMLFYKYTDKPNWIGR